MIGNVSIDLEYIDQKEGKTQPFTESSFLSSFIASGSFSNSSSSGISSIFDPEELGANELADDNMKIRSLVKGRLMRFIRASKKLCESSIGELENCSELNGSTSENDLVEVKSLLKNILMLKKQERELRGKLKDVKCKIKQSEKEEACLKQSISNIDDDYKRFILETNEMVKPGCLCLIF